MEWKIHSDRPVYLQLMEKITTDTISGVYAPGERLPSVRDLSQEAGVNPNTMQKALSELEWDGLVFSRRTAGRFITEDAERIKALKSKKAQDETEQYLQNMRSLGLTDEEIQQLLLRFCEQRESLRERI